MTGQPVSGHATQQHETSHGNQVRRLNNPHIAGRAADRQHAKGIATMATAVPATEMTLRACNEPSSNPIPGRWPSPARCRSLMPGVDGAGDGGRCSGPDCLPDRARREVLAGVAAAQFGVGGHGQVALGAGGGAELAQLVPDVGRGSGGLDRVSVTQVQQPALGHAADVWPIGQAEGG